MDNTKRYTLGGFAWPGNYKKPILKERLAEKSNLFSWDSYQGSPSTGHQSSNSHRSSLIDSSDASSDDDPFGIVSLDDLKILKASSSPRERAQNGSFGSFTGVAHKDDDTRDSLHLLPARQPSPHLVLDCPFRLLPCLKNFPIDSVENWIRHSLTHFVTNETVPKSVKPPTSNSCPFCEEVFNHSDGCLSWKRRMEHVAGYHRLEYSLNRGQPDYALYEYMWQRYMIDTRTYQEIVGAKDVPKEGDVDISSIHRGELMDGAQQPSTRSFEFRQRNHLLQTESESLSKYQTLKGPADTLPNSDIEYLHISFDPFYREYQLEPNFLEAVYGSHKRKNTKSGSSARNTQESARNVAMNILEPPIIEYRRRFEKQVLNDADRDTRYFPKSDLPSEEVQSVARHNNSRQTQGGNGRVSMVVQSPFSQNSDQSMKLFNSKSANTFTRATPPRKPSGKRPSIEMAISSDFSPAMPEMSQEPHEASLGVLHQHQTEASEVLPMEDLLVRETLNADMVDIGAASKSSSPPQSAVHVSLNKPYPAAMQATYDTPSSSEVDDIEANNIEADDIGADAASVLSAEGSVFSVGSTISSQSSIGEVMTAIGYIFSLFLEDPHLRHLFEKANEVCSPERFERNLKRLIRRYAADLKTNASTSLRLDACRLIQRRAGPLAGRITSRFFEDNRKPPLQRSTGPPSIKKELLERYLNQTRSFHPLDRPEVSDSESGESDVDEEAVTTPNLDQIRHFLLNGPAFETFKEEIAMFLQMGNAKCSTKPDRISISVTNQAHCEINEEPEKQGSEILEVSKNTDKSFQNRWNRLTQGIPQFMRSLRGFCIQEYLIWQKKSGYKRIEWICVSQLHRASQTSISGQENLKHRYPGNAAKICFC